MAKTAKKTSKKKKAIKKKKKGLELKSSPCRMEEDWEAKSALDTLVRAEEIKSNKKLLKRIEKQKKKEQAALERVNKFISQKEK